MDVQVLMIPVLIALIASIYLIGGLYLLGVEMAEPQVKEAVKKTPQSHQRAA